MRINDLKLIYISEFTVRFCTWSIMSGLLMHLNKQHSVSTAKALYITGSSLSLLYLCNILGGFIKDRFFNEKQTIILGLFLIAVGNINLFFSYFLYIGLGIFFIGAGMVSPNTSLFISSLVKKEENNKAFTIFYGITNLGIILGPIAGGIIGQLFFWKGIILVNELLLINCFTLTWLSKWHISLPQLQLNKILIFVILIFISNQIIYSCFNFEGITKYVLFVAAISYCIFIIWLVSNFNEYGKKIIFSIFLIFASIVFFSAEFQVTSSLIVYAQNFVQLNKRNYSIPPSLLVSCESIFVVICAYIIVRRALFVKIKFVQTQVLLGLMYCFLAFLILYVSTQFAYHEKISLLWLVFPYFLLGFGEVTLMPAIISYVAKASPGQFKGVLMSGLYFALSIAGYISGLINEFIMQHNNYSSQDISFYSEIFITLIVLTTIVSLSMILLRFNRIRSLGVL